MSSPPPTPRKDVLSRLRPQRIHRKNSEASLNPNALSPPAAFTQFRKQLSTRIKKRDKDKGSFYIKDGAISDGIVNNRKRVAVSNGKIVPGEDGTGLDLDLEEEDEVETPIAEGKESIRRTPEPESESEDEATYVAIDEWDVSIDGGKFDIKPTYREPDFMAELEGTTPAIVVELEGSSVPGAPSIESSIQEKEGDSPIQEKDGSTPADLHLQQWSREPPTKQVRHVGLLMKDGDIRIPTRKESLVRPVEYDVTVKGEAERFITPLFSPVSPLERCNPIDQLSLGRPTPRITPVERNPVLSSIEERDTPRDSPHQARQQERFASPLERNQPLLEINYNSDNIRNKAAGTVDTSMIHPLLRQKPSNNELRAISPTVFRNLPESRCESPYQRNDTPESQKQVTTPLEPRIYTLEPRTYSEDPTRSMERVASPSRPSPTRTFSQDHEFPKPPSEPLRADTLPPTPSPSPQRAHHQHRAQSEERQIQPLSLKNRAETMPISPTTQLYRSASKATSINTIKRKQLPIRQDSVAYAVEAELRKVEAEQKLARQRGMNGERASLERASLERGPLIRRDSNEVSWLSL